MTGLLVAHDSVVRAAASRWTFEPVTVTLLVLSSLVYATGVRAAWRQAGAGAGFRWWQAGAFAAGIATLAVAQISPLAWLSDVLFSAHMAQHEILMLISAPLLVMGQPLLALLWAVPAGRRQAVAQRFRGPAVTRTWRALTAPFTVLILHAVALWVWHVPALFQAALADEGIHFVQHMCFLVSAALFWWGMIYGRYGRIGYGVAILYVFVTALHSTILGALLTVAPGVWYPAYEATAAAWRLDPLADQQLAGLIMWVPAGVGFLVVGLALVAAWLGDSERRVARGSTALLLALAVFAGGCGQKTTQAWEEARTLTGGEPDKGIAAIGRFGCGSCHTIPGVQGATGTVGPPLNGIASRGYLAGQLSNSPSNMILWIRQPQHVEKGTAMPDMGINEEDARNITAYLYTLR